jgi:DNA helicase MCM9
MERDYVLATMLLRYPFTLMLLLEEAIIKAQRIVIRNLGSIESSKQMVTVKGDRSTPTTIHARLVHLPPHINCCKASLSCIDAGDIGRIVQLSGTVVRITPVRMVEKSRAYICLAKNCGHKFVVYADFEQSNNALNAPTNCPNLSTNNGKPCRGTNFDILPGESEFTDYQEVKVQESASRLGYGVIPNSILVKLFDDLIDCCQPGDDVVVVGTLSTQWQPTVPNIMCDINFALHANSVRALNSGESSTWEETQGNTLEKLRREFFEYWSHPLSQSRPIAARNHICRSVCPKLYGLMTIKLALLLTLIGGSNGTHFDPLRPNKESNAKINDIVSDQFILRANQEDSFPLNTSSEVAFETFHAHNEPLRAKGREQCHLLLVGDAGCGKSVILQWASTLSPRSVLTTGVGTTSAGLTCAAVRDGKEFVLEAGALVLADRGICCIDEFGCIREDDRTKIHEAMEQQTLSVAKGGIVCKLSCRTTIIAACNPKGGPHEFYNSLPKYSGIGMPLLSRFDLVFRLVDLSDVERDQKIATHLLNRAIQGSDVAQSTTSKNLKGKELWNIEKLRAYIATARSRFKPRISISAAALLQSHYQACRLNQSSTVQVTARLLEALIRLSQAHARLMFRDIVTLQDAVSVILLMESSAWSIGCLNTSDTETPVNRDPLDDFPDDAECDEIFLREKEALLLRYGLSNNGHE